MADETNPEALSTIVFYLTCGGAIAFAAAVAFFVLS